MYRMSVTLDVSKLSGWLNAGAPCREKEGGGHRRRGDMRASRREGGVGWSVAQEAKGRGTHGAHLKHVRHACDAGRVEAQRLVERGRSLAS